VIELRLAEVVVLRTGTLERADFESSRRQRPASIGKTQHDREHDARVHAGTPESIPELHKTARERDMMDSSEPDVSSPPGERGADASTCIERIMGMQSKSRTVAGAARGSGDAKM
jgi:hypothetical protein